MLVKCLNCETIYDHKSDEEKCCDKCICNKNCPSCGSNSWVPIKQNESIEQKKQILHD